MTMRIRFVLMAVTALIMRATAFQGRIGCDHEFTVYLDGAEVASDTVGDKVNDISLAVTPTVIAAKCVNKCSQMRQTGGIIGSFDDDVVTDTSWRCSATESDGWTETSFDDSAWASAVESTDAPPLSCYGGVSPSAKFIWSDTQRTGTAYCRKNLTPDSDDGEVTPEGCKFRGEVHPAGETWIQEFNSDPLRQRECTCPDPLPETWHAKTGGCTAACVMSDGVVHYGGDKYQRTVDGATLDCRCNSYGRERCSPSSN